MTKFRAYIAQSVDGYIATPVGGTEWLHSDDSGDSADVGYDGFFDEMAPRILTETQSHADRMVPCICRPSRDRRAASRPQGLAEFLINTQPKKDPPDR